MTRIELTLRRTVLSLAIGAAALAAGTGCSTVKEHRVDAATGQVETVNRKQFVVKRWFGAPRERVRYVQSTPGGAPVQGIGDPTAFAPQPYAAQIAQQPMTPQPMQPEFANPQSAPPQPIGAIPMTQTRGSW